MSACEVNNNHQSFSFQCPLFDARRRCLKASIFHGTPFVPTGSELHGAQGGAKASPLGGGTGRFFASFAKNTGATF
jgi:hypothetical protein